MDGGGRATQEHLPRNTFHVQIFKLMRFVPQHIYGINFAINESSQDAKESGLETKPLS